MDTRVKEQARELREGDQPQAPPSWDAGRHDGSLLQFISPQDLVPCQQAERGSGRRRPSRPQPEICPLSMSPGLHAGA